MSYTDRIPPADLADYKVIKDWEDYYDNFLHAFERHNPNDDISNAELTVENKIFEADVFFTGEFKPHIKFLNCYFQGDIKFYKCQIQNDLSINHCFCDGELFVFGTSEFNDEFNLINLILGRQIYVEGGNFYKCRWNFLENAVVKIAGGDFDELNIGYWGGAKLRELTLHNLKTSGYIKISGENTEIEHFSIFQSSKDLEISIEDIRVNLLSVYRYRNENGFRLINIKPLPGPQPSEISITESYMGKAELYSLDLTSFENVTFYNSHLIDTTFVNIKWNYKIRALKGFGIALTAEETQLPEKLKQLEEDWFAQDNNNEPLREDPAVIRYFINLRETFRQLKFALGKQGDLINEQKFHTQEMLAYDKSLRLEEDFWTIVIIKFSYWFSDFGQSFTRPLIALLLGHFALLLALISFNGIEGLHISFVDADSVGFRMAIDKYLFLINPLRKLDDGFPGYTIIIDVLMRIWSSYMIYNLIRATRRFIK